MGFVSHRLLVLTTLMPRASICWQAFSIQPIRSPRLLPRAIYAFWKCRLPEAVARFASSFTARFRGHGVALTPRIPELYLFCTNRQPHWRCSTTTFGIETTELICLSPSPVTRKRRSPFMDVDVASRLIHVMYKDLFWAAAFSTKFHPSKAASTAALLSLSWYHHGDIHVIQPSLQWSLPP